MKILRDGIDVEITQEYIDQKNADLTRPLEKLKAKKKAEIQAEKIRVRDGGVLIDGVLIDGELVNGVLFDTDLAARVAYRDFKDELDADPSFTVVAWKASKGVFVMMDAATLDKVRAAGKAMLQPVYAWQMAREKELDEADNPAAVDAVSSAYPG